jgi:hypothetical protein
VNIGNNAKIHKLAFLILFFMIIFLSLTYSGIAAARDNSQLLVFTDADAKDAHRVQEVIDASIAKTMSVTSLLTNQCSRRKRSDLGMLFIFLLIIFQINRKIKFLEFLLVSCFAIMLYITFKFKVIVA